ncbi:MAG: hypothetical protein WCA90_08585 [Ilumatobacteraceae bacterium]
MAASVDCSVFVDGENVSRPQLDVGALAEQLRQPEALRRFVVAVPAGESHPAVQQLDGEVDRVWAVVDRGPVVKRVDEHEPVAWVLPDSSGHGRRAVAVDDLDDAPPTFGIDERAEFVE